MLSLSETYHQQASVVVILRLFYHGFCVAMVLFDNHWSNTRHVVNHIYGHCNIARHEFSLEVQDRPLALCLSVREFICVWVRLRLVSTDNIFVRESILRSLTTYMYTA